MAVFQVFKSPLKKEYYFLLKATGNSQLILSGQGFPSKQNCIENIESFKETASSDDSYQLLDQYLSYTFLAVNKKGIVIGKSENYTTEAAREQIIILIKRDATSAVIQDLT